MASDSYLTLVIAVNTSAIASLRLICDSRAERGGLFRMAYPSINPEDLQPKSRLCPALLVGIAFHSCRQCFYFIPGFGAPSFGIFTAISLVDLPASCIEK